MFCGTDIILWNIERGNSRRIFHEMLSIPQNNVMDLKNVMMHAIVIACFSYKLEDHFILGPISKP